uniref:Uncharacterized protein n=1 Tax=Pavo cristatus TaxID=9049 RepID=A0A8C9L7H1_PAVCR
MLITSLAYLPNTKQSFHPREVPSAGVLSSGWISTSAGGALQGAQFLSPVMYSVHAPCPFRYLYFYKHTVDLLREHGIVSTEEVPLPVVSTAISHLWQELSEERRDSILQYCSQRDFRLGPADACQEPACTDGDVRDSGGNSEEASGSLVSTPEEVSARARTRVVQLLSSASLPCSTDDLYPEEMPRFLKPVFFCLVAFFFNLLGFDFWLVFCFFFFSNQSTW